jgi:hypothetical protein
VLNCLGCGSKRFGVYSPSYPISSAQEISICSNKTAYELLGFMETPPNETYPQFNMGMQK